MIDEAPREGAPSRLESIRQGLLGLVGGRVV